MRDTDDLDSFRDEPIRLPAFVSCTEDGLADAFSRAYFQNVVYDHTADHWFIWRNGRWKMDDRRAVFNKIRQFLRAVNAAREKPNPALSKVRTANAVEKFAQADPRMAVSHEVWDTDKWLLGTPDGVVNLRTGVMQELTPGMHIARYTSVAPAPTADCPMWLAFLDQVTAGDKELQTFIQRMCGYALTGDVSEEVVFFLYGPGGNGKGVLLFTLTGILGDYAVAVPIDVFTAGSRINLEYYRAVMSRARLVTASETEAQASWAESQIKELTGSDMPLSARMPYGRPFTYLPEFKIALVGNHAPKLKAKTPAMERRLRILPFNVVPTEKDEQLKEKLRAEWAGILRWIIDGCLDWQKNKLGTSAVIQEATKQYFEAQNAFGLWLEECCTISGSGGKVGTGSVEPGKLLDSFKKWAKENHEDPLSANQFAELLDRTPGLKRDRRNGKRWVDGIMLKPTAEEKKQSKARSGDPRDDLDEGYPDYDNA